MLPVLLGASIGREFLRELVLAEGGAAASVAATFLDIVLFAGGLVDTGNADCE